MALGVFGWRMYGMPERPCDTIRIYAMLYVRLCMKISRYLDKIKSKFVISSSKSRSTGFNN